MVASTGATIYMSLCYLCNILPYRSYLSEQPVDISHSSVSILPCGISDHAPVLLKLELGPDSGPSLWWLSCFWISDEHVSQSMTSETRRHLQWFQGPYLHTIPVGNWQSEKEVVFGPCRSRGQGTGVRGPVCEYWRSGYIWESKGGL